MGEELDTPFSEEIEQTREEYFRWLCSLVLCTKHHILLSRLHQIDFFWTIPNDDNRETDGKDLRKLWWNAYSPTFEKEVPLDSLNMPCSVLEMMIGLARRCENDIMHDDDEGDRSPLWFWEMVKNLGLVQMTDDKISSKDIDAVYVAINRALSRTYDFYGLGGFFPLSFSQKDQREVEIWYQMQAYLNEKFPI